MPLTQAGRNFIASAVIGAGVTPFDNANARIGVGDGTTVFASTQTDLQGTNKFRKGMEVGYPQRATNVLTFKAVIGPADANFAWQEWGIFNGAVDGEMLNRLVEYNGAKLEGQTWIFECELTINIGT